jgi:hypothetical protein
VRSTNARVQTIPRDYLEKVAIWYPFSLVDDAMYQRKVLAVRRPCVVNPHRGGPTDSNRAALQVNPFRIQLCSFGANPVQEEVNSGLSMPFLGFWIRCDAVKCKALGMPEHKIEEHVSRKFRVIYLDLTARGGLTQYT